MSTLTAPSWVGEMLKQRGVNYEEVHHADVPTAQEVAAAEHFSGHRVAKVVVAMADKRPVELVLPASRQVSLERVRQILGARDVRLATEEEIGRYFEDCEVGAMPPLRHWKDVDVLMDASMRVQGNILFQAGTHRDAVRLRFEDWVKVANPRVESFSVSA